MQERIGLERDIRFRETVESVGRRVELSSGLAFSVPEGGAAQYCADGGVEVALEDCGAAEGADDGKLDDGGMGADEVGVPGGSHAAAEHGDLLAPC